MRKFINLNSFFFLSLIENSEMLTNAIRLNAYPIDFSIYATCPRAIEPDAHEESVSAIILLIK